MFNLYGLLLGIGIVAGFTVVEKKATEAQRTLLWAATPWMFLGGVVGARIYHLVTDWHVYRNAGLVELVAVWNGGLGIYGAIIGIIVGGLAFLWVSKKLQWKTILTLLDLVALGLPLGQAIGRWGNYLNHELFGLPTQLPWGIFISPEFRPAAYQDVSRFHPLFFYESAGMFLLWVMLWRNTSSDSKKCALTIGSGRVCGVYLLVYGLVRFFLDFLRMSPALVLGISVGQMMSILAMVCGLSLLYTTSTKSAKI